jgi:hypothetical protein
MGLIRRNILSGGEPSSASCEVKSFQQKLEAEETTVHEERQRNEPPLNLRFARDTFDFGFSHFEVDCLSICHKNISDLVSIQDPTAFPITRAAWTESGFHIP